MTRRRTAFRLRKAQDRLHLVEGLLIAILDIDEVIAVIRSSDDSQIARDRLVAVFDLTEIQADYILELRLRRLTKFSQIELENEKNDLVSTIAELEEILASDEKLRALISSELAQVAQDHGTARRTVLLESDGASATAAKKLDLKVADDPCWVMLSGTGLIARVVGSDAPSRVGPRAAHDAIASRVATTNLSEIGVVTTAGNIHRLNVVDVPAIPATDSAPGLGAGAVLSELLLLEKEEKPLALVRLDDETPLALATEQGKIKRVSVTAPGKAQFDIIKLTDGDRVVSAAYADDASVLALVTSDAQLLRFDASAVRPQGRSGQGIAGIRLADGARVIALGVVPGDDLAAHVVVTVAGSSSALPGTAPGSAKVTPLDRYPAKGRGTGGVRAQRFLRGEDELSLAWIGPEGARAVGAAGQPVDLPAVDERRDASGSALTAPVVAVG